MPGPQEVIRAAVVLPFEVARTVLGLVGGLLPGHDDEPEPETVDLDIAIDADDAMTRERDPVEEAPLIPDDEDFSGHVDQEVEVVAESADPDASDAPGPEIHVER